LIEVLLLATKLKTIQKNGFPYLRNATKKHFGTWFQSTNVFF